MYIVNGNFATCADIVTSVIDSSHIDIITDKMYLILPAERRLVATANPEKSEGQRAALIELSKQYKSILTSSNYLRLEGKTKKHTYICVDPTGSQKEFDWVTSRVKHIAPEEKFILEYLNREIVINKYFSDHIIKLEDVVEGRLIEKLREFIPEDELVLDEKLYEVYLSLLHYDFPY